MSVLNQKPKHLNTLLPFTLLAFVLLFLFSCKKDDDEQQFAMTNQEFVNAAASSNNFEVAAGALVQTKSLDPKVIDYGEHMVADHTQAMLELKALVSSNGLTISDQLLASHQQNLTMLTQTVGVDFDKKFAQLMVQSHQEAVNLFQSAAGPNGVASAELRAMAASKLPTLKSHLESAIALQTQVNQ